MPSSNDYNAICYLARYPDVRNNTMYHSGKDGKWYYENPGFPLMGTKKISDDPFWHWQNFGLIEGRVSGCDLPGTNYSNEFNAAAYLARYPDIRFSSKYKNNPLAHYQTYGINEGRHPGFEILTSASPVGMVSPGTTTLVLDNPDANQTPGDGTVITPVDDSGTDLPPVSVDNSTDIGTWVSANPLLVAGIGAVVLLLIHENKKKKRRARA